MKLTTAQTGSQAVLLVQRQLLSFGVDSAPMTTDYGVDLVAYRHEKGSCFTIQVKCRNHNRDGKHSWRIEKKGRENPSKVFALVDMDDVWYMRRRDVDKLAVHRKTNTQVYFYDGGGRERHKSASTFVKFKGFDGIRRLLN
jgi:hypothetical protein